MKTTTEDKEAYFTEDEDDMTPDEDEDDIALETIVADLAERVKKAMEDSPENPDDLNFPDITSRTVEDSEYCIDTKFHLPILDQADIKLVEEVWQVGLSANSEFWPMIKTTVGHVLTALVEEELERI